MSGLSLDKECFLLPSVFIFPGIKLVSLVLGPLKAVTRKSTIYFLLRKQKSFKFSKIDLYVFRRKDTLLDCLTPAKEDV